MLFIGTWDQCQRSGEMPVMRCDTRQGQFWMQNEAIATTSEFHIQNSSLKAKANPTNYFRSLDDEQLGPLQMADHDHAGNATNTNSGSKVNPTLVLNNNKSTVVASAAAALCDKLKNGSQTALRSTRHSDVDDDDEDESLTTSTTTSSPSSSSSSAEDSGGGNDDMDDDPDMSSAFCDDLGSCGDNDPAANNGLFDDEGDDGVEMVVDSAHVVDDQFGGGGGRCVVGQRVVTIANGPQLAGDLDDDDDEMDDEDDDDDYSGDGQLGLRRRRRRKTSEGRVELDDDEDDEMDDVDDTKDHHQETTAATTVVTLPTECHLPIAVEVVDKDQVQKSTLKNDSSPDVAATIAKGTNNNNNVNNNNNNSNNNNNNNSLTKRPNKRKNFKPRNIVYQQQYEDACDDVDNDFIDDYNTASCWDASLPGHPNSSLSIKDLDCYSENTGSPERRTMLLHPNDNCSKSSPGDVVVHLPGLPGTLDADSGVDGGGEGAGDSDQPLDLSDCATSSIGKRTSLAKSPPHQDGPCRETVDISEDRGCGGAATASMCAVPVRAASSLTLPETSGTPMDLTVSRGTPEPVRTASRDNAASSNCSAMDLSKGPPPSVHHAVPSLCSSSSTSSSSSSSTNKLLISGGSTVDQPPLPPTYATTSQQPNNVPQSCSSDPLCSILAPVVTSGSTCRVPVPSGRSSGVATAVPMVTPPSVTGLTSISASLLGLHADLMSPLASHSSASVRSAQNAAATAVAVHAAALGLTQAIRDRDEVHEGGSGGGLLLPPPMDAPTMKDYAESTVKELLGLYGINDMAESITKDVPLPNFSSGLTPGGSPLSTSLFKDGKASPVDYSRYVKRFSSSTECGHNSCKDLNYREHFHCLDCNSRVFVKKEEMIRHFKWHKKRDESLQHGFLRFSPMDDCSEKFPNCSHNRKQTHYHCLKDGCDKVYISTSDVQMHANYHRKDSAIIQEGFQRFRATEDCATPSCSFSGQRTTHFHCRRPTCNYTFKNKADMEKHKSYHIKDEQLNRDGFKKFMKHEHCMFENCRFSRVCNHIHCIRPGCSYVLHSSGQLYSHKRKHERRENEMAYRKFKLAQSMMRSLGENQVLALQSLSDELKVSEAYNNQFQPSGVSGISTSSGGLSSVPSSSTHGLTPDSTTLSFSDAMQQSFTSALLAARGSQHLDPTLAAHGLIPSTDHLTVMDFGADLLKARLDDAWKKYLSRYTANDPCKSNCEYLYKDHYHCNAENCTMVFRSKDGVREHARNHEQQDQVTEAFYNTVDVGQVNCCPADCPYQSKERHYHCGWQSCREIILASDKPFRRLDHYKMHEYSHKLTFSKEMAKDPLSLQLPSSMEGIFKRKRGRPPKNRVIEFPLPSGSSEFPQAIYTSFKLPKPNNLPMMSLNDKGFSSSIATTSTSPTISKPPSSPLTPVTSPLGHLPQNMIYPKAFAKLSQFQPHIQKHLCAVSPTGNSSKLTNSEDDSSDRPDDDEDDDDGVPGAESRLHREDDVSDDSSTSSNRFPNHLRSSPSTTDSTPPSHPLAYSASFLATSAASQPPPNDLLFQTFPSVPGLPGAPTMTFLAPGSASSVEDHRYSPVHRNGNTAADFDPEHSSHDSMPESGIPSPTDSLESNSSSQFLAASNRKRAMPLPHGIRPEDSLELKKMKLGSVRILKDEPVPEGYIRYRFNEDCHYGHCGYREHQTHFHCIRTDCGYSFCDKTRFVQHTARHERLDTLMGGDFQQFRANVSCGRPHCIYSVNPGSIANKASHFHCFKCDFVCTDTNKVVAHRRQHQKLDTIMAAGFEKFTASQSCKTESCSHNQKQTHYHCLKCQYAVLGLSQMSAHKYRHLE